MGKLLHFWSNKCAEKSFCYSYFPRSLFRWLICVGVRGWRLPCKEVTFVRSNKCMCMQFPHKAEGPRAHWVWVEVNIFVSIHRDGWKQTKVCETAAAIAFPRPFQNTTPGAGVKDTARSLSLPPSFSSVRALLLLYLTCDALLWISHTRLFKIWSLPPAYPIKCKFDFFLFECYADCVFK